MTRGFVEGIAGRTSDARATLRKLEMLSERKFVTSYGLALVHAALGDTVGAFACLDKAFAERSNWLIWLRLDLRWKTLRLDPRFEGMPEPYRVSGMNRAAGQLRKTQREQIWSALPCGPNIYQGVPPIRRWAICRCTEINRTELLD